MTSFVNELGFSSMISRGARVFQLSMRLALQADDGSYQFSEIPFEQLAFE